MTESPDQPELRGRSVRSCSAHLRRRLDVAVGRFIYGR
jgi:hypothetical protein